MTVTVIAFLLSGYAIMNPGHSCMILYLTILELLCHPTPITCQFAHILQPGELAREKSARMAKNSDDERSVVLLRIDDDGAEQ